MTGKNKKSAVRGERTGRRKGGWMSVVNQVFFPVHDFYYSNGRAIFLSNYYCEVILMVKVD
jgi:hypothetical protein